MRQEKIHIAGQEVAISRHKVLGLAVTSRGNIFYLSMWDVPERSIADFESDEKANGPIVGTLPINGLLIVLWEGDKPAKIGYEVEGEVTNYEGTKKYETVKDLISDFLSKKK
ncbi:MAG: hypothetical protein M1151_07725 [Candidatus Thermoplasmatota archaeon]|nr:hypothetical protein [Candidatus Thermoplasmatota archaeon]MCL5786533.1 hypothetical protein [Candidatus Thermoplasmatota archaeon]